MKSETTISREEMIEFLNEDLAREYQAIISYVVYSQTMKGAAFTDIAGELEKHAAEELEHALLIARQRFTCRSCFPCPFSPWWDGCWRARHWPRP